MRAWHLSALPEELDTLELRFNAFLEIQNHDFSPSLELGTREEATRLLHLPLATTHDEKEWEAWWCERTMNAFDYASVSGATVDVL
jgi:hypothetical protein